jgi:outer membrane protein assembly factor BamB
MKYCRNLGLGVLSSLVWCGLLLAEDWPRWRGPRGDGTWHGPRLRDSWPAEGLRVCWSAPCGGGYAGLVAAEGKVFVFDRLVEPEEVERITCRDAASGRLLWEAAYAVAYEKLDYGNGPRAAPTLHEGAVYTLGAVGHVSCYDAATGSVRWQYDARQVWGAVVPEWGFAASPVMWKDAVIVHVGARPNGCLLALDRRTGRELWRAGGDPAGYATPIVIERDAHHQLVVWTPEHVLGLDPDTGRIDWQIPYPVTYGVSIATPIYAEGMIFVSGYWEGAKAIALGNARHEAQLRWEDDKKLRGLMSQPLYRQGHAYLLDKTLGLTCFELATGRKLWDDRHRMTPRDRNPQATMVWIGHEDRALVLNANGELILARLSPQAYIELARAPLVGPTWVHPAYAGRHVFARDEGRVLCAELPLEE